MPYKVERKNSEYVVVYFLPYDPDGTCDCETFPKEERAYRVASAFNNIERKMAALLQAAGLQPGRALDIMESWITAKRQEIDEDDRVAVVRNDVAPLLLPPMSHALNPGGRPVIREIEMEHRTRKRSPRKRR